MRLAMKIKVAITAAALASPIALTMTPAPPADNIAETNSAEIAATNFPYRVAGDFSAMANKPRRRFKTRQVPAAEYANCVDDGGCPRIAFSPGVTDRPVVGVSWHDATAYTEWMTRKTGRFSTGCQPTRNGCSLRVGKPPMKCCP